jgi:hypothetical protein
MTNPFVTTRFMPGLPGRIGLPAAQPATAPTPEPPAPPPPPGQPAVAEPAPVAPPTAPPPPVPTPFTAVRPAIDAGLLSHLGDLIVRPTPPPITHRTFTQMAQEAIGQLRAAPREILQEAVRTLQAKSVAGPDIVNLLERRTRIGEVLGGSAARWSAETVNDFAAAFQMDVSKTATMDQIVALGLLNDRELESELRQENLPPVTAQDLLQNRRIVFQHPAPGTELQPPYVILVAVEHQDLRRAEDAVAAILGQLVDFQGYRMPRDAAARLG